MSCLFQPPNLKQGGFTNLLGHNRELRTPDLRKLFLGMDPIEKTDLE
jgi:hypothetical protein